LLEKKNGLKFRVSVVCTFSRKNDVISLVRKHYRALGLGLELGLGLAEIRFRSNVFSSKCSRSQI